MVKNSFYTMEKYQKILKGSVLEIGSDRHEGSTEYFNNICQKNNVDFYSVDCEQGAYERAKSIVGTRAFKMKGEDFIKGLESDTTLIKFSFVFLDNFDFFIPGVGDPKNLVDIENNYKLLNMLFNNEESQKTHLLQAQLIQPYMMDDAIIGFDDTWQKPDGTFDGKGGTAVPWLLQNGYTILDEGRIGDVIVGGYVILSKMKVPIRIKVITCCKNEEKILPFFLQYYSKIADEILVYDGGSTDMSVTIAASWEKTKVICTGVDDVLDERKLMKIRNEECRIYNEVYDWLIIVDADEFLYHPNLRRKLTEYKITGVTYPKIAGYNMRSLHYPVLEAGRTIVDLIKTGVRDDKWQAKRCVFNPNKAFPVYDIGCHAAVATGDIVESNDTELSLLHYRWLGYDYFVNKNRFISNRLSGYNKENNFGYHTTIFSNMSNVEFEKECSESYDIFNLKIILGNLFIDGYKKVGYNSETIQTECADSSVIEIICKNLEAFNHYESWKILNEFKRILVPGGKLIIEVTDLFEACKAFVEKRIDLLGIYWNLYGNVGGDDQKKIAYTKDQLAYQLINIGFNNLSMSKCVFSQQPELSIRMECYK
jgi:glycosyltransferase involved in cell wall biosynthesis